MSYQKLNGRFSAVTRTDSLCPQPETVLLESVLNNDILEIEKVVEQDEKLLEHIYEPDEPILLKAISADNVEAETVEKLLDLGADITASSEVNEGWAALHYAAQRADRNVLKVVLNHLKPRSNINQLANGNNALHILVRQGRAKPNYEQIDCDEQAACAKLLIERGINVNQQDGKSRNPILWAAQKSLKNVVKVIIDESDIPVDLDSCKVGGKTARDIILEKGLYDRELPPKFSQNLTDKEILFRYIRLNNQDGFIAYQPTNEEDIYALVDSDNTESTLLQASCGKHLTQVVQYLIGKGADPNKRGPNNNKFPIEIAVQNRFYDILEVLLATRKLHIPSTILTNILQYIDEEDNKKCYDIIKKSCAKDSSFKRLVNSCDPNTKNTPLHFAVRYGENTHVEDLLDLGASLGAKNSFMRMPIQDMDPDILGKHLDNCIKFDKSKIKEMGKEEFTVTFDYNSLIPPREEQIADEEGSVKYRDELLPETDVVEYMSRAPEFKHLLKHPVIVSFLFIKWHRIRWLFYSNLTFYIVFFSSLVGYIFSHYADFSEGDKSKARGFLGGVFYFFFLVTFLILVFRELFQIAVSPAKYLKNIENYVELALIGIAGAILFTTEPSINTKKQLSAISILLSAFELVIMLGQHPKLSTNVVMLRTVSMNFFKFLLWYSVLILAFAMSFYILFTDAGQDNTNTTTGEEDDDSFKDPGRSMFKTIVMLTGEFDASSINFQTFPVTSKLIFSLFIFMIAIILVNLLNGLAVSDTQMIKNDAELLGHISRAQHVSYVESMLLGNILPRNFLNWINEACCCVPTKDLNLIVMKPLAERVCLYPHYELTVYLNKSGQVVKDVGKNKETGCRQRHCPRRYLYTFLDRETLRGTRDIIREKINTCEKKKEIDLVKKIEDLERKLDGILQQLKSD